ncbi:hypothetical protein CPY51_08185 [Rhizobium tubonense]|uniref:Uncharacterized protein n=1 Tax=Rhizobium tubonense TaxID=484088 RepID=A0A2W4CW15_9HYPH|nr:hypothetical protein CPY51_08185 [Rhizobium tubonense]
MRGDIRYISASSFSDAEQYSRLSSIPQSALALRMGVYALAKLLCVRNTDIFKLGGGELRHLCKIGIAPFDARSADLVTDRAASRKSSSR